MKNSVSDVLEECKMVYTRLAEGATYAQLARDTGKSTSALRSQKQFIDAMLDTKLKEAIQRGRIPSPSAFTEFKVCPPDIQQVLLDSTIPVINSNVCRSALALTDRLQSGKMNEPDFVYELTHNSTHWRKKYTELNAQQTKKKKPSVQRCTPIIPDTDITVQVVPEPIKDEAVITIPFALAQEFMQCSTHGQRQDMTVPETEHYISSVLQSIITARNNVSGFKGQQQRIIDLNYEFIKSHKANLAYLNSKKSATEYNMENNRSGMFDGVTRLAEIMCAIDIAKEDMNVAVLLAEDYIVEHPKMYNINGKDSEVGLIRGTRVCHPDLCVIDFCKKTVDFVDIKMKTSFIGWNKPKDLTGADVKSVEDYKTVAAYYAGRAFLIAIHCEPNATVYAYGEETPTGVLIIGLNSAQKGVVFKGKGKPLICYEFSHHVYKNSVIQDNSRWALLKTIPKVKGILSFEQAASGIYHCGIYAYIKQSGTFHNKL